MRISDTMEGYRRTPSTRNYPSRREPVLSAIFKLAILAGLVGFPVLVFGFIYALYAYFYSFERILPGVEAGGVPLAGKTMEQAAMQIHRMWNIEPRLLVTDGRQSWDVPPYELGLQVDPIATAAAAHKVGRSGDFITRLGHLLHAYREGTVIEVVTMFDEGKARSSLEALAGMVYTPSQNASLHLEDGKLVVIPALPGLSLDFEDTLARLALSKDTFIGQSNFELTMRVVPPELEDLSPAIAEVKQILEVKRSLLFYDPVKDEYIEWNISQEDVARWLHIDNTETGPQVSIGESAPAAYLSTLSTSLDGGRWFEPSQYQASFAQSIQSGTPLTIVLKYHPTTYTVEPGDTLLRVGWKVGLPFWKLIEANPGLDPDALYTGQRLTVPPKDEMLPLPVVLGKRIIISISEQRLWTYQDGELLSEHVISTGVDRSPTQPGIFQVRTHELSAYASLWDLTMPHFIGIYEAWPGFMNGIHGLPTLSSGQRLWANVLGRPASYGCIILDLPDAEWLFGWADPGVVVEIKA
jgi:LysM repeat protein